MLISIERTRNEFTKPGVRAFKAICRCKCDTCEELCEKSFGHRNRLRHYCSRECWKSAASKGGPAYEASKATNVQNHGVEWVQQLDETKEKGKKTTFERFGVECSVHNPIIREQINKNCLEQHGVLWPIAALPTRKKIEITNLERFGCINPLQNVEIAGKIDRKAAYQKRLATVENNLLASKWRSIEEIKLFEIVQRAVDVETSHSVRLNGWSIDMFVPSLNVYIQYDGDFWHGKGRSIEELELSDKLIDKEILRKQHVDASQNDWSAAKRIPILRLQTDDYKNVVVRGFCIGICLEQKLHMWKGQK